MYRYTTPTLPITIDGIDFADIVLFRVAIEQKNNEMLKVLNAGDPSIDAEHNIIYVPLTQEETASFNSGMVQVQVRVKFANDAVLATNKVKVSVDDVLDEVII